MQKKGPPHHAMLSFCCFCTRDFGAPLIGLGDGSRLPTTPATPLPTPQPHKVTFCTQPTTFGAPKRGRQGGRARALSSFFCTLPALQKSCVNFCFGFAWGFCCENRGDSSEIFCGLHFPGKKARKILKDREKSEQNSAQNSRRTNNQFGDFFFCAFSDLKKRTCEEWSVSFLTGVPALADGLKATLTALRSAFFLVASQCKVRAINKNSHTLHEEE